MAISRIGPSSFDFGVGIDHLDQEGRVVTLRFDERNITIIGDYTPCSRIGIVPERRKQHERAVVELINREQTRSGGTKVIYVADRNVAPTNYDVDTTLMKDHASTIAPSLMDEERALHAKFKADTGLQDAYLTLHGQNGKQGHTWFSRHNNNPAYPTSSRIDFVLCQHKDIGAYSLVRSVEILNFRTSDHRGLLARITDPIATQGAATTNSSTMDAPMMAASTIADPLCDYADDTLPIMTVLRKVFSAIRRTTKF